MQRMESVRSTPVPDDQPTCGYAWGSLLTKLDMDQIEASGTLNNIPDGNICYANITYLPAFN